MFANRYTALIDACSLVSLWRRNFLLSLAEAEFFRIKWSSLILSETEAALIEIFNKRNIENANDRAKKSITTMRQAFPEAEFANEHIETSEKYGLPDLNDEHVLYSAIMVQAQTIITENIKDFPEGVLKQYGIEARTADDFIADTISLDETKAVFVVKNMRFRLKRPEITQEEFIKQLEANGMIETANILSFYKKYI